MLSALLKRNSDAALAYLFICTNICHLWKGGWWSFLYEQQNIYSIYGTWLVNGRLCQNVIHPTLSNRASHTFIFEIFITDSFSVVEDSLCSSM